MWTSIKHGVQYTIDGCKMFWMDIKLAKLLLMRIARGDELTRQEKRTVAARVWNITIPGGDERNRKLKWVRPRNELCVCLWGEFC